ncbi:efflux RND transporter permease subunit [Thermopirellula anaerolimosa]
MLNELIRFSLRQRLLVTAAAVFLSVYGLWQILRLPIDVFPDLNRPRVVILTEAPGLAPEEVETLVTFPLEAALNGAAGVQVVRSSSSVGLSVIYVEFDWGTDPYRDRQIVNERLGQAADQLPPGIQPQMAPISSIMGQIQIIGMYSRGEKTSPMELRTLADWVVRQRLRAVSGVSQVIVMGGDRKQFQVLLNPHEMRRYGISLREIEQALSESNQDTAGGYLDAEGVREYVVRSLGRVRSADDIARIIVARREGRSVRLSQVARIVEGAEVKRGDSAAFVRGEDGRFEGGPAVVLTVNKQPGADTRRVTQGVRQALREMEASLPDDVRLVPLYEQKAFIDQAVENVAGALRDGSVLVVIVLILFLMNVRTTIISLTAIPLSLVVTAIVFHLLGLSINTMTLGGLAVAVGELVDDAIVDVENIYRRLRENRRLAHPRPALWVVYQASCEIRNSVVYGTLIVVMVFLPLTALSGIEGRLFVPLAVAYITSLAASLLVSLTVTPVMSYWLLGGLKSRERTGDGPLLKACRWASERAIRLSLRLSGPVLASAALATALAAWGAWRLDRDFLPPFNEGAVQINVLLPPGVSLAASNRTAQAVEKRMQTLEDVTAFVRKTGRAELDEHAEGVHVTEVIATIHPRPGKSREQILTEIHEALEQIPGIVISVEQPMSHLISFMLSGVKAQVAIKLFGDDLEVLRREAEGIRAAVAEVPGVRDLQVEPQTIVPQLRIEADTHALELFGLRRWDVNGLVETALAGKVISQVLEGQRSFDLLVRLDEPFREDVSALRRMVLDTPDGGTVKLEDVARIYEAGGPNIIQREQVRRRIIVQCNVSGRGLVDVVEDMKRRLAPIRKELPTGYYIEFGGQFESRQTATRTISLLMLAALSAMLLLLWNLFGSVNLALQVMIAVPMAFIGGVAALYVSGQTLTVAAMVGFISLCGIAVRNGILLTNHYLHLVRYEGESWTREMIVRAGKERVAPVLMTALTSGIGLAPLALSAGEPGREILYPVAVVIIGGLISGTLAEFLVRPALFQWLGLRAAQRVVDRPENETLPADLSYSSETPSPTMLDRPS